jgi:hypothetical protein
VWLANTNPSSNTSKSQPVALQPPEWNDPVETDIPDTDQARAFLVGPELATSFDPTDQLIGEAIENAPLNDAERRMERLRQLDAEWQE